VSQKPNNKVTGYEIVIRRPIFMKILQDVLVINIREACFT